MPVIGDDLLSENKITEAVEMLKLNVTEHPDSWNAYNSLGKAYKKMVTLNWPE